MNQADPSVSDPPDTAEWVWHTGKFQQGNLRCARNQLIVVRNGPLRSCRAHEPHTEEEKK